MNKKSLEFVINCWDYNQWKLILETLKDRSKKYI